MPAPTGDRVSLGIAYKLLGLTLFSMTDAAAKLLVEDYSTLQIIGLEEEGDPTDVLGNLVTSVHQH